MNPIDSQISWIPTQREEALSIRGGWVSEKKCPKRSIAPSYRDTPVFSNKRLPDLPEFSEFPDDSGLE